MGLPGRTLDPDGNSRNKPAVAWLDVVDKPYRGKKPVTLPKTRVEDGEEVPIKDLTKQWWDVHTSMPHCSLWAPGDWQFALDTALLADMFYSGKHTVSADLRTRLKVMGATHDARLAMRIRYVKTAAQKPVPSTAKATGSNVTHIDERRLKHR